MKEIDNLWKDYPTSSSPVLIVLILCFEESRKWPLKFQFEFEWLQMSDVSYRTSRLIIEWMTRPELERIHLTSLIRVNPMIYSSFTNYHNDEHTLIRDDSIESSASTKKKHTAKL